MAVPSDLRNRTLHIHWQEAKRQNGVFTPEISIKETAVINVLQADPSTSIADISAITGFSRRTIDRIINSLKDKDLIQRTGPKNRPLWTVILPD